MIKHLPLSFIVVSSCLLSLQATSAPRYQSYYFDSTDNAREAALQYCRSIHPTYSYRVYRASSNEEFFYVYLVYNRFTDGFEGNVCGGYYSASGYPNSYYPYALLYKRFYFQKPSADNGDPACSAGNPISIVSGNKYQKEKDLTNKSRELSIVRYYNSQSRNGEWLFEDRSSLTVTNGEFFWLRRDGKGIPFRQVEDNQWISDGLKGYWLSKTDSGTWRIASESKDYFYTKDGELLNVKYRNGFELSYSYSSDYKNFEINASDGSSLTYSYSGYDRITSVEHVAPTGESQFYRYTYQGNNLVKVTFPSGEQKTYHYEDSRFPAALTGITDERGVRYASWAYDSEGRAISSEHGNDIGTTLLAFNTDGSTTVTNQFGKKTTYHFSQVNGVKKVARVDGHESANCTASNRSYEYYDDGMLKSRTDWNGNVTTYTYDDSGREISRTEAAGTPQARIIATEWHSTLPLKTKVTQPTRETLYTYDNNGQLLSTSVRARTPQ